MMPLIPLRFRSGAQDGRTRWTRIALALLVASGLLGGTAFAENRLETVAGPVEIGRGDPARWTAAQPGDVLAPMDRLRTGSGGHAEVSTPAGTLRVFENSLLRLPPAEEAVDAVELDEGYSLFDVLRRAGKRFEVRTPTVVVSVKGTRFGVHAGEELGEVVVYHGLVGVRDATLGEAIETLVREGFRATGGSGLPIELDLAPGEDPWMDWETRRGDLQVVPTPERLGGLDRVRATLQTTTDRDVLREAVERRPELRRHLREALASETGPGASDRAKTAEGDGSGVRDRMPPAALGAIDRARPDPAEGRGGRAWTPDPVDEVGQEIVDDVRDLPSDVLRGRQPVDYNKDMMGDDMQSMDEALSSSLMLTPDLLKDLSAAEIVPIVRGLEQTRSELATQPSGSVTNDDARTLFESNLIDLGLDPQKAADVSLGVLGP